MSRPVGRLDRLRVTVVGSVAEIGRGAWTRLAESADAPVFYSYDFLRSVERAPLSSPSTAYYLLGHDADGTLGAALVLYRQETVDPFASSPDAPVTRMLVGHVWHCYDTTLVTALPITPALVESFCVAMDELADDLAVDTRGLVNVEWGGPLARCLAAVGLPGEETAARYRVEVPATGGSVADHLASVGRSSRRSLGRYRRRAERAGARISFTPVEVGLDDAVLDLCLATADKHAPGYYPPGPLRALLLALGPACRVLRVELDGVLLAASICLRDRRRDHFWAGGCRYPEEFNWSPQYVLFGAELEAGLAGGKPVVEFGRRNDEFKRRYGLAPRRLGRFVLSGRGR